MFRSEQQDRTQQSTSDELHQKRSRLSTFGENEPENRIFLTAVHDACLTDTISCTACIDPDMTCSWRVLKPLWFQALLEKIPTCLDRGQSGCLSFDAVPMFQLLLV